MVFRRIRRPGSTGIGRRRSGVRADALYNLGSAYRGGKRLPLDLVEAYKFLEVSVARYPAGSSLAADTRTEADALGKQLTPAQLEDARRRAADYVNAHPGWPKVN